MPIKSHALLHYEIEWLPEVAPPKEIAARNGSNLDRPIATESPKAAAVKKIRDLTKK
jgi:hypothetical protein